MCKKFLMVLAISACLSVLFVLPAFAAGNYPYVKPIELVVGNSVARVGGDIYKMDVATYVKDGRTLVPLRFLGEALGATVVWDGNKGTAVLKIEEKTLKVIEGSSNAYVSYQSDDEVYDRRLDVPAEIKSGRIFVPLRFISEEFGALVNYEHTTSTVTVYTVDRSEWTEIADGVFSPIDWTGEITQQQIYHYKSPNNSEVWIQRSDNDFSELVKSTKEGATKNGFRFVSEDNNLDLEAKIVFIEEDSEGRIVADYLIILNQREEAVIINEIFIPVGVSGIDYPVIDTIIKQYHYPNRPYDEPKQTFELITTGLSENLIDAHLYVINSGSMAPTILPNEKVMVDLGYFNNHQPKRGDIVMYSTELGKSYLHRIVAVEGDKIQIKKGLLLINEKEVPEPYLAQEDKNALQDISFEPMEIPKGHVFLLGDNRTNSFDSRIRGPIPIGSLQGKYLYSYR